MGGYGSGYPLVTKAPAHAIKKRNSLKIDTYENQTLHFAIRFLGDIYGNASHARVQ